MAQYNLYGATAAFNYAPNDGLYTLGVVFRVTAASRAVGVRFYKNAAQAANIGRTAYLYRYADQALLASGTFTGEVTGWNTATLTPAVTLVVGTLYIAAYSNPDQHIYNDPVGGDAIYTSGILVAPRHNVADAGSGTTPTTNRFAVGAGVFPATSFGSRYWVDVVVDDSPATTKQLKLGTATPGSLKVGTTTVLKGYLGTTLVWEN